MKCKSKKFEEDQNQSYRLVTITLAPEE